MMKKLLLATFAALVCVTVRADDLIVYKQALRVTTTGGGIQATKILSGWFILDAQTLDVTIIRADPKRKRFTIETPLVKFEPLSGNRGSQWQYVAIQSGEQNGMIAKGVTRTVDIFVLDFYNIASSLPISGSDLFQNGGTDFYLDEYKGSLIYDRLNTKTPLNRTMAEKVQQFKNSLILKGYTEEILI